MGSGLIEGWLRWWLVFSGMGTFFWLSLEDSSSFWVAFWGANLAISGMVQGIGWARLAGGAGFSWVIFGLAGGFLGVMSTVFLMFFKSAWHGHIVPDYPFEMMVAMLTRAPGWALAGALVGAGMYGLWRAFRAE